MVKRTLCLLVWMAALAPLAAAQAKDLAPGKFLIASRDLLDPNFAHAVVLLIHHDEGGAMGLIINRRTKLTFSQVLDGVKEAKGRSDPVYVGGPVELAGVLALLRSRAKPEDVKHVFGDVYLISSKAALEKALAAGAERSAFRAYLGYTGWGAGQLEREIELGAWSVWRGDPAIVFDADPETVWPRLIKRTEAIMARSSEKDVRLSPSLQQKQQRSHRSVQPPLESAALE